jgi:hypothetical protein
MPGLDQNASFLIWALAITIVVLGGYALYLRSRLIALRKRAARDQSERKVSTAAPMPTTAHPASSANEPSAP